MLEKSTDKNPMLFTFIDAVARYGREMVEGDLEEAYRRAGKAFQGQLQQNFGVLRDRESDPVAALQGATSSTPRKRQREDEIRNQEERGARSKRRGRGMMGVRNDEGNTKKEAVL
jgi:hypothetical protein